MNATETADLAETVVKETARAVDRGKQMVDQVADSQLALELAMNGFKKSWLDWIGDSETILKDFRLWRMAMSTEAEKCLMQFGDVRKFFLSSNHEEEMRRLKEFVDLMERLKALKDSGFLDKVTDTMLRMEEK